MSGKKQPVPRKKGIKITKPFVPGYIFGEFSEIRKKGISPKGNFEYESRAEFSDLLRDIRTRDRERAWNYIDTPLAKYTRLDSFNLQEYLMKHARSATQRKETLDVLDVGIGSGKQWTDIMQQPGIRVWGSNASHLPSLLPNHISVVTADKLHKKFNPHSFDFIVTHMGIHFQDRIGIENIVHLLKPGGEAIITGDSSFENTKSNKHYTVLKWKKNGRIWTIHIKKRD
jgi:SAM-dependent methyltransferase